MSLFIVQEVIKSLGVTTSTKGKALVLLVLFQEPPEIAVTPTSPGYLGLL
jgi:hypothetical protein